jgi:hypothetical protein
MDLYGNGEKILTDKNLIIGGRNYLKDTSNQIRTGTIKSGNYFATSDDLDKCNNVTFSLSKSSNEHWFTASAYLYNDTDYDMILCLHDPDNISNVIKPHSEGKVTISANIDNLLGVYFGVLNQTPVTKDQTFRYTDLKLEKGQYATDWTPNPQDFQDQIDQLKSKLGG